MLELEAFEWEVMKLQMYRKRINDLLQLMNE